MKFNTSIVFLKLFFFPKISKCLGDSIKNLYDNIKLINDGIEDKII